MKALLIRKYGGPEAWEQAEVSRPSPRRGEVLVRVHAASINPIDWKIRNGMLKWIYPLKFPSILGKDVAGEIVELGAGCSRLRVGNRVFGGAKKNHGSFAEYCLADESDLASFPDPVSFEKAAALPIAALTSLQSLRDLARLSRGQQVLIIGASGGVGTFAVQIAKIMGAHVTAVCSGRNQGLVQELGADSVIDYTRQDPTRLQTRFDAIFDATGHHPFSAFKPLLKPHARFITTLPSIRAILSPRAKVIIAKTRPEDLAYLAELVQNEALRVVIDRTYPLSQLREATNYSEEGHARGKIVIVPDPRA